MAGEPDFGEQIHAQVMDALWHWMYHALDRIYGELDRDAAVWHVTVGVTTPRGETLVYAVRKGLADVQRVIVTTDQATQASVQAVLEQATTDATVPSHNGRLS